MYCKRCGAELHTSLKRCPSCNAKIKGYKNEAEAHRDRFSPIYVLVGFFFIPLGLVLYFMWMYERPKHAKYSLIGVFMAFGFYFLVYGLYTFFSLR